MKTNDDIHAASFGQLLRHDMAEPWMWLKPLTVGALVWLLGLGSNFGVIALIALCALVGVIAGGLVQRTQWCGDTAFWRTRPVSRSTLFAVKTAGFTLLCVIPALVVALIGLSDLDDSTWTAVMCLGLAGLIAVTSASASAAAIGSLGGAWQALGWQAVFGAPVLSFILLGVLRVYLPILTPIGSGGLISGMMVGLSLIAFGSLLAWLAVGLAGKAKAAALILLVSGLAWPWVAGTFRGDFFKMASPDEVVLKVAKGESLLRMPMQVGPLDEGEWFVPQTIAVSKRGEKGFFSQSGFQRGFGSPLVPTSEVRVFSQDHRDFSSVMDIEKLWEIARLNLPKHSNWVPTEKLAVSPPGAFKLPATKLLASSDTSIRMEGNRYRFVSSEPVHLNSKMMPIEIKDGLKVSRFGIPNANSIDVELRITRSALEGEQKDFVRSISPPDVWGVLYHEESRTAYGTASSRARHRQEGLREIFLTEEDLVLRFELPHMESALLGLDPRKVLSQSMLYLFVVEDRGEVTAE